MPSTPSQPREEGPSDASPQQNERHAWDHFLALLGGRPCPVCAYDPSKNPRAIAIARLHAVIDDPVLRHLEWGVPPGDATDTQIRLAEYVRTSASPPQQPPMSEEQRAAMEADSARLEEETFKELAKIVNSGMSAEREREAAAKEEEGRRLYRAAREHGRQHRTAREAANKDGPRKRWGRSQLFAYAARWKAEWEAEHPE